MGITFIGMGSRSSGQVRGYQLISNVRKYNFYDTDRNILHGSNTKFMENIVFVRSLNEALAKKLKKAGHKIGFDIIDRPVAELHK